MQSNKVEDNSNEVKLTPKLRSHSIRSKQSQTSHQTKTPNAKVMKKFIEERFSYERKKTLFLTVNTITIALTLFNMLSVVNIEAQYSLIYYEETSELRMGNQQSFSVYYFLFILIMVHVLKLFCCVIGNVEYPFQDLVRMFCSVLEIRETDNLLYDILSIYTPLERHCVLANNNSLQYNSEGLFLHIWE